jgi:hypothetical protein
MSASTKKYPGLLIFIVLFGGLSICMAQEKPDAKSDDDTLISKGENKTPFGPLGVTSYRLERVKIPQTAGAIFDSFMLLFPIDPSVNTLGSEAGCYRQLRWLKKEPGRYSHHPVSRNGRHPSSGRRGAFSRSRPVNYGFISTNFGSEIDWLR